MRRFRISCHWLGAVLTFAMPFCASNPIEAQTISPPSLSFGNWVINTTASRSVTLTNNQSVPLSISSISVSGQFTESSNCPISPKTLASGATCSILVVFAPTILGAQVGTLTANNNISNVSAALSGAGVLPVVVAPSTLVFAQQLVNTTTPVQVLTVQNYQTVPLQISGISVSGDFSDVTTCPVAPNTLAARSSCQISIAFSPTSAGALTGTLTVSDNAADSPQVQLTGTGVAGGLGAVTSVNQNTCPPGFVQGVCYGLTVSCPAVGNVQANLKVTEVNNPIGTIVLASGGNGTTLWEANQYGPLAINNMLGAGYSVVQVAWVPPYGWQIGPGGMRAVACRPATVINWVYSNIHENGSSAPMCAAGTSAGSEEIGLGLAYYGLGDILAMAELISGPPFSREDSSCECNQPKVPDPCGNTTLSQCVGAVDALRFVDPAYSSPICSQAVQTQNTANGPAFLSDSIVSPDASLSYPASYVHFVWGGQDLSSSPAMGQEYQQAITSSAGSACVADAPHEVLSVPDGATQVSNDLISSCHLYSSPKK